MAKTATFVNPAARIDALRDQPDNRILECAVESNANLIVSGDFHLVDLKNYEGVGIVRAADLIHIVR
jgi:putative PIN family toxin of toxin-antitoxin system